MRGRLSHRCWKTAMQMRAYTTNDRCWIVGSGWDEMDAQLFILMSDSWGHLSNTQRAGSEGRELPGEPLIMPTLNTIRSSSPLAPVRSRHNRPGGMPVQNTKRERWDGEKVHRRNGLTMVSEERQPSLQRIWISRSSPDPSRDTPFREIETQLEQFAVNARRSPGRILGNHSKDQGANLFADTLPPSYSSES